MKRVTHLTLMGAVILAVASLAAAQQTPQPVVRLGNWIEVGNDVFMHIMATADIRYTTNQNSDFESRIRDQALSRNPSSTSAQVQQGDLSYAELRFGAEFKYQKNFHFYLLFENQTIFDGNTVDDRSNASNPGGTDVFGRAASTENPGFRVERYWARYKFAGTPLLLHVGADLQSYSQAGILGNDNPRFALEGDFGALKVSGSAVIEREAQRLGLTNDNDSIYYAFTLTYDLKPHRFGFDVVYFRDRFLGADTQVVGYRSNVPGWTGQKTDSVWIDGSWSGRFGPVQALLQGNLMLGTARGANARGTGATALPAVIPTGRDYDIFAGSVIAYAEADLGIVRPFIGFIYGSGDGDPRDNKLHGFAIQTVSDSTQITGTPFFAHLDTSSTFALRDYQCPGAGTGLASRPQGVPGNPYAVGAQVLSDGGGGASECSHSTSQVWNNRLGSTSHVGLVSEYSNPGTMLIPVGLKVFPAKGHDLAGYYVYRAMATTNLLEIAFAPELAGRGISKTQYHGIGGYWQWTLNPYFDIRLSGEIAIPGDGYKDLGRLADCNPGPGFLPCDANDPALKAEARFRARF